MSTLPEDQDEKPLDPAMEKVRRKMVRLLVVSIGIMFVGVMAVLGAIVYKFTRPTDPVAAVESRIPSDEALQARAQLPAGFSVESVSLDGERAAFYGRMADGSRRVLVHDLPTGRLVFDLSLAEGG